MSTPDALPAMLTGMQTGTSKGLRADATGDGTTEAATPDRDLVSRIRAEGAPASDSFFHLCGFEVVQALRHAPTVNSGDGWQEVVAAFRGGILVSHECTTGTPRKWTRDQHLLYVHPNGTLTALNHHRHKAQPRDDDSIAALVTLLNLHEAEKRTEVRQTSEMRKLAVAPKGESAEEKAEREARMRADRTRLNAEHELAAARRASELHAAAAAVLDEGAGIRSTDLDLGGVQTMHALGAGIPSCERVVLWMAQAHADPLGRGRDVGQFFGLTDGWLSAHQFGYVPTLYAAVMWAQEPFWPRGAGQRFLAHGITPANLRAWGSRGWTVHQTVDWLRAGARFEIAEQWRAVGDISTRAARLAGFGEVPNVSEQPWLDAGFAPGESDAWRTRPIRGRVGILPPDEAYEWHRHGVVPNSVYDFERLPTTAEEAEAKTAQWMSLKTAKRPDGTKFPGRVPTRQRALEWSAAGVPSEVVLAWCRKVGDDDTALAAALEWSRVLPAAEYTVIEQWNRTHPQAVLTCDQVARLRRLGVVTDGENMSRILATGLSNTNLLRPVLMLSGKRWLGIDLRHHFTAAAKQHVEDEKEGRPTAWEVRAATPQHILDGRWNLVGHSMRSVWDRGNVGTWRHYLDWLETNPTPPPPRGTATT